MAVVEKRPKLELVTSHGAPVSKVAAAVAQIAAEEDDEEVLVIRMISGEELLARVEFDVETYTVQLNKPVQIMIQPGPQGRPQVMLAPWPNFMDQEAFKDEAVEIHRDHIIFMVTPRPEFVENYKKTVDFPNVLKPSASLIVPG